MAAAHQCAHHSHGPHTSTSLCELGTVGSQQRRPNARWAAVGEASEASRNADVTIAHAHAQQYGGLGPREGARRPHACSLNGTRIPTGVPKVVFRTTTLALVPVGASIGDIIKLGTDDSPEVWSTHLPCSLRVSSGPY